MDWCRYSILKGNGNVLKSFRYHEYNSLHCVLSITIYFLVEDIHHSSKNLPTNVMLLAYCRLQYIIKYKGTSPTNYHYILQLFATKRVVLSTCEL